MTATAFAFTKTRKVHEPVGFRKASPGVWIKEDPKETPSKPSS